MLLAGCGLLFMFVFGWFCLVVCDLVVLGVCVSGGLLGYWYCLLYCLLGFVDAWLALRLFDGFGVVCFLCLGLGFFVY